MKTLFSVSYVNPVLRNFLIRNDVPFEKPRKKGGNLKVQNCYIKKDPEKGSVRLCFGDRVIDEMPEYVRYIQNLLTTEADLLRKKGGEKSLDLAARLAADQMNYPEEYLGRRKVIRR